MSKGICKVFVSVLLMLSIITVLTVHAVSNETYNNTPIIVDMFDPNAQKEALPVNSGERLGFRFHATASFDALEFCCPSWGNNIGSMSFSIYEWNKDFDTTLSQPALATVRHINFTDNAVLKIGFDEMLSGEYMVLFHDSEELVGVWSFFSNVSGSYLYLNGVEYDRELQANIHYCETPESNFIECESTIRPPSEPNLYEDHILNTRDVMSDTWTATDGLGRTLPTNDETGDTREDKFVGIFYWTWHDYHSKNSSPYNVSEILKNYPESRLDTNHPAWGGYNVMHHWNEPLFGYYTTVDDWVLRKHAEMLADAGVDVMIFDNSNGIFTWQESYTRVFEVFSQARKDGVNTPKIAFLLPFASAENTNYQLEFLYNDIYKEGKYNDLWFYWEGKPLIMANGEDLITHNATHHAIKNFFTFRAPQSSYTSGQTSQDMWGWMSIYPQQVYYNEDGTPEQITVSVAQNHSEEIGLTAMNGENVFDRTYTSEGYDTQENAELYGANFAQQFEYAIKVDPEFIFITGWNEWVAGRAQSWQCVDNAFPDQYNDTASRDIEPSKGKLKDHYYYQMVSYIRAFKGTEALPEATDKTTININSSAEQWNVVGPVYYDYIGATQGRSSRGYQGTYYTSESVRNDIAVSKVARDDENLYFYVECDNEISGLGESEWMRLLIDVGNSENSWESFEYILNRREAGMLERSLGGWNWEEAGRVEWNVSSKCLQVVIPVKMLGISGEDIDISFKWADDNLAENESGEADILDLYSYGDTAPNGRFKYRYVTGQ
ncbi:MAG: hypothetical protein IJA55_03160 [Clostridia bacterium]|nr:hypothetical protein [Clostridia bacterium]